MKSSERVKMLAKPKLKPLTGNRCPGKLTTKLPLCPIGAERAGERWGIL
jgi:hypothetical protein